MSAPLISLCMIVGNVQEYIERCLQSFKDAMDELCLVRAIGAAEPDDTIRLAEQWARANGKAFKFAEYTNAADHCDWPHVDDFAAARNLSFDLAAGDYLLWCDSDDVLEPGSAEIIRELAARNGYGAYVFSYRIFARGVTVMRARMMSRGSGRWVFPVHEDYRFLIEPVQAVEDHRVVITHLPDFATKTGSNERNLRILRAIPEKEMTCGLYFHLHGELAAVGDVDESIKVAKKALASPDIGKAEKVEIFLNFAQLAKEPQQKEVFLHAAYQADPTRREALGLLCNNALNHHCNRQALAYARQMMATMPPASPEWNDRTAVYGWVGDDLYAQALRANGFLAEAETVRGKALAAAGGARIALVHATRGRIEQATLARKMALDLAERPDQIEYLFVFDPADQESAEWLSRFHHLRIPGDSVTAWNAGCFATEAPVIVQMSDDFAFPARWDQLILDRIGDYSKPSVLAVSDGVRKDQLLTMAILTRAYWRLDWFLFHPWFQSVYSDDAFTELAYKRGAVIEARDLVFQHNHPIKTGQALDATYANQNSPQRYHDGKKLLEYLRTGNDWSHIQGWFNFYSFYDQVARRLKDGDTVCEIGCWLGRSIIFLAQLCSRLGKDVHFIAVDHFKGEAGQPEHQPIVEAHGGSIRGAFEENIRRCGVADKIKILDGDSAEMAREVADGSLSFVYIDAGHEYTDVRKDILAWRPKVKKGGILGGHDAIHEPVERAVHELLGNKVKLSGNTWFLEV